jgi:IS30 family transposase
MKNQGYSIRKIAKALSRSISSISDELNQKQVKGIYLAKKAHLKTYQRRYWSKYQCFKGLEYQSLIQDKLTLRWSPERISGYLKRQGNPISAKAIYKFCHSRYLERYLWKPKKTKHKKAAYLRDYRKFAIREPIFETGHLEVDFVVSSANTQCLLVAVDRYSRLTVVLKLENRNKETIIQTFELLKQRIRITDVITDNDIAFSCWGELEKKFGLEIFFTQPYRSWEKPLVEQTNKLIRQFIPKKTNLRLVSQRKLQQVHQFLNQTPRQCLNYLTAYEKHFILSK